MTMVEVGVTLLWCLAWVFTRQRELALETRRFTSQLIGVMRRHVLWVALRRPGRRGTGVW